MCVTAVYLNYLASIPITSRSADHGCFSRYIIHMHLMFIVISSVKIKMLDFSQFIRLSMYKRVRVRSQICRQGTKDSADLNKFPNVLSAVVCIWCIGRHHSIHFPCPSRQPNCHTEFLTKCDIFSETDAVQDTYTIYTFTAVTKDGNKRHFIPLFSICLSELEAASSSTYTVLRFLSIKGLNFLSQ
jgi:hypothetical protein